MTDVPLSSRSTSSTQFEILYEDNDFFIINKPAGVVVNNAQSVTVPTVQDWAAVKLSLPKEMPANTIEGQTDFYSRAGIVHRIDKETSGCLVIAKTPQMFLSLQALFKERLIKKSYVALVHGDLVPAEGEIKAPIGRLPWNRERFGIVPDGKEAVTKYTKSETYKLQHKRLDETLSLVNLFPESGRTHQIRVHLKYINHPIVGDYLYAGRKVQRDDRLWCPRVFLHAFTLQFIHPKTKAEINVQAPLPADLLAILATLQKTS